jgi:uncharacterized OsmC-like protein
VRDHHFILDGPIHNGCPGEEVTPAEAFLAAVAACGVELVQVIAREDGVSIGRVEANLVGTVDRSNPPRPDYTVFNKVVASFIVTDTREETARDLVERFTRRCPLFGTVAVATPALELRVTTA